MPKGQGKGAICNISVNVVDICNTLSRAADSNGLVVVKITVQRHRVSVARWDRLTHWGNLNFQRFLGVRPGSRFFTGQARRPVRDGMSIH